jgi:hypothetical protein
MYGHMFQVFLLFPSQSLLRPTISRQTCRNICCREELAGAGLVRLSILRKARVISKFARVLKLDEDGDERHQHAQDSHRQVSSENFTWTSFF